MKCPMLLDIEPFVPENKFTPRDAARALVRRTKDAHPHLSLHVIFDSGFGSFDESQYYLEKGVLTTMSMPSTHKPWLWEMLRWKCPVDSGRIALLPVGAHHVLVSLYHVASTSGEYTDLIHATTAFSWQPPPSIERVVRSVDARTSDGLYPTTWGDGSTSNQPAKNFVNIKGVFNIEFLRNAGPEDVRAAIAHYKVAELKTMSDYLLLRVQALPHLINC